MNQQLFGMTYDYVRDNGNYLVFGTDGNLKSSELANLQMQMLQSNTIPRLLPISTEELDLSVSIRFDISSKRMLSQAVQAFSLTLSDYFELLLHIAIALDESKSYMLMEQNYVLQEDFIFVGAQPQDVYLVYLPLKQLAYKKSVAEEFRELAMNLIGSVREVRGDGFQSLLNFCKSDSFSVAELRKLLKQIHQSAGHAAPSMAPMQQVGPSGGQALGGRTEAAAAASAPSINAPAAARPQPIQQPKPPAPAAKKKPEPAQEQPLAAAEPVPLQQKERTILLLAVVLANALIWKLYLDHAGEGMLLICLGLTLLTVDAAYVFVKFRHLLKGKRGLLPQTADKPPSDDKRSRRSKRSKDIEPNNIEFEKSAAQAGGQPQVADAGYYNQLSMQTTLLGSASPGDTVLLNQPKAAAGAPFVEVRREGQSDLQPIHGAKFVIGRGGPAVTFVEDVIGVSRMHLEISQEPEGWTAKDLGSKNGSLLNEEPMTAYKGYLLKDGDVIKIVKTEFVFRTGQHA